MSEETFFEVIDKDGSDFYINLSVIVKLTQHSNGIDPVYAAESEDGIFIFFSDIPITEKRIKTWYDECHAEDEKH